MSRVNPRSRSRGWALQVLYAWEQGPEDETLTRAARPEAEGGRHHGALDREQGVAVDGVEGEDARDHGLPLACDQHVREAGGVRVDVPDALRKAFAA